MISGTKFLDKLEQRLDAYIDACDPLMSAKADGYAKCFEDVTEIIEEMEQENKIKAAARRAAKKFLGKKGA